MEGKKKLKDNSKIEENKNKILTETHRKTSEILKKAMLYSIENLKQKSDRK